MTGREVQQRDKETTAVGGGEIGCVDDLVYLGSEIAASGRVDMKVERCITLAAKAFGA